MSTLEPRYPSGEEVHAGDEVVFDGIPAQVVFVSQRNEYLAGYPRSEWSFVPGDTVAIRFEDGRIMMYDSFCGADDIKLLSRGGAA